MYLKGCGGLSFDFGILEWFNGDAISSLVKKDKSEALCNFNRNLVKKSCKMLYVPSSFDDFLSFSTKSLAASAVVALEVEGVGVALEVEGVVVALEVEGVGGVSVRVDSGSGQLQSSQISHLVQVR